ncbi:tRNA (adenosine(37)-N6)-dimethylallyltransferase MiaA [bacterium]|nr:tRNA (adenosine(37)-N6)-dimethylallyltransferase MiaA [bacterium]
MNKKKVPFSLCIYGPTASGKTDFALELAQAIPAEIINGDMGQFYTPMSIGTAKPDWKNEPVKHHLFDLINEPKRFTVCEYRRLVIDVVHDIWSRGKLPIIVGGSGFYLKSIFFPPCDGLRADFIYKKDASSNESLWEQLNIVDSKRARQIDKADEYRLKRALAIWQQTGKKPSEFAPKYEPPFDFLLINLDRDRKELYERIDRRTAIMLQEGWIEEAQFLLGTQWEPFLYEKKVIGYDILFNYLKSAKTKDDLLYAQKEIQKVTRHYAKRQQTFFKSLKRQLQQALINCCGVDCKQKVESVDLTLLDRHLYIKQLSKRLWPHLKKV